MSWHFNSDYESWLFKDLKSYSFPLTKENREFEHFVPYFESSPLYSSREYSAAYIKRFEQLANKEFKTVATKEGVRPWWCPINEKTKDRELHSKATSNQLAIELGEAHGRPVNKSNFAPKDGHIYKRLGELSGRGNYLWPKHKVSIEKALDAGESLIEEPLRERFFDFSSLVLDDGKVVYYKNLVDDHFHYKGTSIGELDWSMPALKSYRMKIEKVVDYYFHLGAKPPFSIDSYLYREQSDTKVCLISEVNPRKTMGYVALKFSELFNAPFGDFLIGSSKTYSLILKSNPNAFELSPEDNQLRAIFIPR